MFEDLGFLELCPPAYVYLIISIISLFVMAYFQRYNPNLNCIGTYNCDNVSVNMIYLVKILYVLFWTFLLNVICSKGGDAISWFLVILPYVSLFALIYVDR